MKMLLTAKTRTNPGSQVGCSWQRLPTICGEYEQVILRRRSGTRGQQGARVLGREGATTGRNDWKEQLLWEGGREGTDWKEQLLLRKSVRLSIVLNFS